MTNKYMLNKQISNENVRRMRSRTSHKRFALVFLLGVLMVLGMIFSGWVRWKQTEILFRINLLKAERQIIQEENKSLSLKLHQLEAPGRADSIARDHLGMIEVDADKVTNVDVEEEPVPAEEAGGVSADVAGGASQ